MPFGGEGRRSSALRLTTTDRGQWNRRCSKPRADLVPTAFSLLLGDPPINRWNLATYKDRATVVDIGKVKLDLPWNDYYEKELDLRFSRSYGPGRYDPKYEIEGVDYPAGYVRWTERRNLLRGLSQKRSRSRTPDRRDLPPSGCAKRVRAARLWRVEGCRLSLRVRHAGRARSPSSKSHSISSGAQ